MENKTKIKIVDSPRKFETVGEAVKDELLKKLNSKKISSGKMPQRLEEDLNDSMENLQIALEQACELSFQEGFKCGFNKAKKILSTQS